MSIHFGGHPVKVHTERSVASPSQHPSCAGQLVGPRRFCRPTSPCYLFIWSYSWNWEHVRGRRAPLHPHRWPGPVFLFPSLKKPTPLMNLTKCHYILTDVNNIAESSCLCILFTFCLWWVSISEVVSFNESSKPEVVFIVFNPTHSDSSHLGGCFWLTSVQVPPKFESCIDLPSR